MRIETLLAVLAAVVLMAACGDTAHAGPFGRRSVTTTRASSCSGGACSSASSRTVVRGGGAQAHAEAMAASGVMAHASSHPGFEGVGYGATPEDAVASCCTNGGQIVDQGVAYGHGRWFACVRRR